MSTESQPRKEDAATQQIARQARKKIIVATGEMPPYIDEEIESIILSAIDSAHQNGWHEGRQYEVEFGVKPQHIDQLGCIVDRSLSGTRGRLLIANHAPIVHWANGYIDLDFTAKVINAALAVERQRREQVECSLEAWHSQFGTSQLSHAIAERDSLKQQLLSAQAAIENINKLTLDYVRADLALRAIREKSHHVDLSLLHQHDAEVATTAVNNFITHTHNPIVAQLNKEIAEVRKRLVEALKVGLSELEELANSHDSDYARPDPETIKILKDALAKAKEGNEKSS